LDVVARDDASIAARTMVATEDGAIHLLRNDEHIWTREESLAHIIPEHTLFLDLPIPELKSQVNALFSTNILATYLNRVKSHIKQLRGLPSGLLAFARHFATGSYEEIELESVYRDSFGFRKFIITGTSTGKLITLDSANRGNIAWSRYLGPDAQIHGMWILRESSVVRDKGPLLGVLLARGNHHHFLQVDALEGTIIKQTPCTVDLNRVNKVFQLPFGIVDDEGRRPIVVVPEVGEAIMLPMSCCINEMFFKIGR
jgi:hypothetical protein